ncbi:MAG: ribonuclease D [Alphaproteobacteria bacterium]|jgi:ribonuclease D|uniref:ribonuclease D n=1 Tax=Pacificispira sp. TaxID=2888761 RepID=UPI001B1E104F|nr:ribonuclease D [Alphaproteobacteria bacterium]MBO6865055.1 ribonuclease D [Alphaproteobacteria bacterium]MEC9266490.1 ribonuclease D [Pseudomonadota bacterium]
MSSSIIATTDALTAYCASIAGAPWVTVDTEFMRDKTYWPKLCLIQISAPDSGTERAIDPLAEGIDLTPLFGIMRDTKVLKVFHAARQDLEIFYNLMGEVPAPLFDTQVAAMVCGFGDQVGYEGLVKKICRQELDKSSRFTDWAHRPLTDRQLQYAVSDVTHLRDIYLFLDQSLKKTDRSHWLEEEMAILSSAETYRNDPRDAWRRVKVRGGKPRFLQIVQEVAAWREIEAQARDLPRNRIIKDDSLLDIAGSAPKSLDDLSRIRGLSRGFAEGKLGKGLLDAVARAMNVPKEDLPRPPKQERPQPGLGPMTDLLKVLLKSNCETAGVASRLIANGEDLERIAADDEADVPALSGWRRELFGEDALALKRGRIALTCGANGIDVIRRET